MGTDYDPQVLQGYADDLYAQAKFIIIRTALKYGIIAFLFSGAGCIVIARTLGPGNLSSDTALTTVVIATIVGMVAGVDAGQRLAFSLKLEAQQLLCQHQIERNTNAIMQARREP